MRHISPSPIPLPAAVLALSVAVCIGAGSPADAAQFRLGQRAQAEQRETLEHLLDAIQQAAKKLNDRLDGQALHQQRDAIRPAIALAKPAHAPAEPQAPALTILREALLNLPPPVC